MTAAVTRRWTYSAAYAYTLCPRQWYLTRVTGAPRAPSSLESFRGQLIHAGLAAGWPVAHRLLREGSTKAAIALHSEDALIDAMEIEATRIATATTPEMIDAACRVLAHCGPVRGDEFIGAEIDLDMRVDGVPVGYRADLIYRRGDVYTVRDWKGLALDTPIPTVEGWSTMGALREGDRVFDSAGQLCSVIAKSEVHYRRCFRVRFDDGSSVICDDEHLWVTRATAPGGRLEAQEQVRSTDEIRRTLRKYGQCHHRVRTAGALDLPSRDLPVDPYVLGCWLGDGDRGNGTVTKPDTELFELISQRGYRVGPIMGRGSRTIYGLRLDLRRAGLLGHKFIPGEYLRASYEQRLDLLRGLMDTDGTWNRSRGQAEFDSVDKVIATDVRELILSLGQRAYLCEVTARGYGKTVTCYRVMFSPINGLNPFALPRKANLAWERKGRAVSKRRLVVAVDEMPIVPTQCIAVDSVDSTYLCTESFIPTHNSRTTLPKARDLRREWQLGVGALATARTYGTTQVRVELASINGAYAVSAPISKDQARRHGQLIAKVAGVAEADTEWLAKPGRACGDCPVRAACYVHNPEV